MGSDRPARVFVAGHTGMVGSAICRRLDGIPGIELVTRSRSDLDLTDRSAVRSFLADEAVDQIYLAAARVGGIHANDTYPADFIAENLGIELAVVQGALQAGVEKLLFLGSSCIYPQTRRTANPSESALLTGRDGTHQPEPYAIAKIAGIKLCESMNRQHGTDYRAVMPTNLYGVNDNFHPRNSHVIPALMRRFHEAKVSGASQVTVWGSGNARREFLCVDDLADACVFVMTLNGGQLRAEVEPMRIHLNVGTGEDISIRQLAETLARVIGFEGSIEFDRSKPDGTPRKLLDVGAIHRLGWKHRIGLDTGLRKTYQWFVRQDGDLRTV